MYTQSSDLTANYQPTEAVITATKVDCFIEDRDGKITDKTTGDLAYLDCEIAPLVAVKFDYGNNDVQQRVKAVYSYRFPVDGKECEGEFTCAGYQKADALPVGKTVPVFANKSKPAESRTSSGNMFVDDKYEIQDVWIDKAVRLKPRCLLSNRCRVTSP